MTALTPSQRVSRAHKKLIEAGGRRMPSGYLQPDAAQALDRLIAAGYAPGPKGCIDAALLEAAKRIEKPK